LHSKHAPAEKGSWERTYDMMATVISSGV